MHFYKKMSCTFHYYPLPMKSGGGYCFGVVRPFIRFHPSSLQLLAGIQQNFMEIINIKRSEHIVCLFQSDPSTQSYGP
jgi:hypothetical protein